ncbi:hypothetical protein [Lysinibacillus sp. G4S2]|uniref:hypothetical protein n=2 Tax=unclassified Lysinibacillus TaxID=2636778 RepID=UPI0025A1B7E2|nr:hypothetical protein [Lysinibacillus sp. G4S2]MDM5246065.1 hypothetical protein [Lysinibacillus sp. G4S2]
MLCAKAKRQQQMFYLCESKASATKRVARIVTRLLKNYLIMLGKSLSVNKVLVRLKEVHLPREAPTY